MNTGSKPLNFSAPMQMGFLLQEKEAAVFEYLKWNRKTQGPSIPNTSKTSPSKLQGFLIFHISDWCLDKFRKATFENRYRNQTVDEILVGKRQILIDWIPLRWGEYQRDFTRAIYSQKVFELDLLKDDGLFSLPIGESCPTVQCSAGIPSQAFPKWYYGKNNFSTSISPEKRQLCPHVKFWLPNLRSSLIFIAVQYSLFHLCRSKSHNRLKAHFLKWSKNWHFINNMTHEFKTPQWLRVSLAVKLYRIREPLLPWPFRKRFWNHQRNENKRLVAQVEKRSQAAAFG